MIKKEKNVTPGGEGGGSENCQKSVTYYLNGPLYYADEKKKTNASCLTSICNRFFFFVNGGDEIRSKVLKKFEQDLFLFISQVFTF